MKVSNGTRLTQSSKQAQLPTRLAKLFLQFITVIDTHVLKATRATRFMMPTREYIDTRIGWIRVLKALSQTIDDLSNKYQIPDVSYQQPGSGEITHPVAFNFANDDTHNLAIARCFDGLGSMGVVKNILVKFLTDLTSGRSSTTCGTLSELLTYLWLMEHQIPFEVQVPVAAQQVLNRNGCVLDGRLTTSPDAFFEVKAFGFQERLIELLLKKLEADMPGSWIAAEGSWDVSVETLEDLLSRPGYSQLLSELKRKKVVSIGVLTLIRKDSRRVRVSARYQNPYQFAEENAGYALRFASQFCTEKPFILIFAHHPWLGGRSLNTDFADYTSTFTRALARRTFIQFRRDTSSVADVSDGTTSVEFTKAGASQLISAIAFLNVAQDFRAELLGRRGPTLRLHLNPNARHPLCSPSVDLLRLEGSMDVSFEDFAHDNY